MSKKITVWLCVISLIIGLAAGNVIVLADEAEDFAEETGEQIEDQATEAASEFQEGVEEFGEDMINCAKGFPSFITSFIEMDNFGTYWADLFTKNLCHLEDIFEMDDEVKAIQQEIRSSYYSCDLDSINDLEKEYMEAKMEYHFVRNCVELKSEVIIGKDIDEVLETTNVYIDTQLRAKMYENFVTKKSWFSDEEFMELFDGWKDDYQDEIETYLDCTGDTWQGVIDKWDEMTEMFSEMAPEEKDEDAPGFLDDVDTSGPSIKFSAESNIKDYFTEIIAEEVQDIGQPASSEEVADEAESNSITDILDSFVENTESYALAMEEAEIMSRYKLLYGAGGADISQSFINKLQELDSVLNSTIDPALSDNIQKTKDISGKQCGD